MNSLFENVKPNVDFVSKFKELKEFCEDSETEKVEVFEENDESNEETYSTVIMLTKNPDEYIKVYTTQPEEICRFIEEHNQVKVGMFVSTSTDFVRGIP